MVLTLAALLLLCACGIAVDGEQARICRLALPALNAPDARISLLRSVPGPGPRQVRLDYRVERPEGLPALRSITCSFAGEGVAANKSEVVGIATERGPLSESTLYFLRRFYLDTPEGVAGDPGPGGPRAGLAEVPQVVASTLQHGVAALPRIAIYGVLASAYALLFGLTGRINLAFGELAAVGGIAAALTALGLSSTGGGPLLALALAAAAAVAAAAVHSAVAGRLALLRLERASGQVGLIATVGLSLALMEHLRLMQGTSTLWLPPISAEPWPLLKAGSFVVTLTPTSLVTAGTGLAVSLALLWTMARSPFGRAWRAHAGDPTAAALCGIDGRRLTLVTLALAGALAGLAGSLVVIQYGGLGFAGGFQLGLTALVAAVVGGIGSVAGAWLGGLAIGVAETVWSATMPIEGRDLALYTALVLVLVFRPGGFLGFGEGTPRQV
jgi:branched-chain amino acid transport system permease protein